MIQLLFVRKHTLGSVLIRLFTWSQWSHVVLLKGNETIGSEAWHGVVNRDIDDVLAETSKHAIVDIDVPYAQEAWDFAARQIGKSYDWNGIFGIATRNRAWQRADYWFCSELVEAALAAGGRRRFRRDLERITPQHSWMVL